MAFKSIKMECILDSRIRIKGQSLFKTELLPVITETSPYLFGNFRKLSLYNCFMPI